MDLLDDTPLNVPGGKMILCDFCGFESAVVVRERNSVQIGSREAVVEVECTRCENCDQEYVTPEQYEANRLRAVGQMRADEGLLQPEEIRDLRLCHGLTQEEMERLLGVGPKTVVRWENGTVFQGAAVDTLLRLIRDDGGLIGRLRRQREATKQIVQVSRRAVVPTALEASIWHSPAGMFSHRTIAYRNVPAASPEQEDFLEMLVGAPEDARYNKSRLYDAA